MHAYNRLSRSSHSSPSPPPSPIRALRFAPRPLQGRPVHSGSETGPGSTPAPCLAVLSVLHRRHGIFLFAPLIYISGMLLYMGTVSFDVVPIIKHCPAPGTIYRSHEVYAKLRPEMDC